MRYVSFVMDDKEAAKLDAVKGQMRRATGGGRVSNKDAVLHALEVVLSTDAARKEGR